MLKYRGGDDRFQAVEFVVLERELIGPVLR
jgi:hypothetical protein